MGIHNLLFFYLCFMNHSSIIFSGPNALKCELVPYLIELGIDRVFMILDKILLEIHADTLYPLMDLLPKEHILLIEAGEEYKHLDQCQKVWRFFTESKVNRNDVVVNVGGGVLTDLGGFCASIYKRGISTINVPTTLMGMVDAAIGGKTAVDYLGVKNLLGAFHLPIAVCGDSSFLSTLTQKELLSGFGEIVKHSLLVGGDMWQRVIQFDPLYSDSEEWQYFVDLSMKYKEAVVKEDLYDNGLRKCLNLGHTIGHALESYFINSKSSFGTDRDLVSHGEAVIAGLIAELYMSNQLLGFPSDILHQLIYLAKENYAPLLFTCKEYDPLLKLMKQDKKNISKAVSYVGMRSLGEPVLLEVDDEELKNGLDFYREMLC